MLYILRDFEFIRWNSNSHPTPRNNCGTNKGCEFLYTQEQTNSSNILQRKTILYFGDTHMLYFKTFMKYNIYFCKRNSYCKQELLGWTLTHSLIPRIVKWQIPWVKTSNIIWPVISHQLNTQKHQSPPGKATYFVKTLPDRAGIPKSARSWPLYVRHICTVVVIATKSPTWPGTWTPSPENCFALCMRYHIRIWFKRGRGGLKNAKNHIGFPGWRRFIPKQKVQRIPERGTLEETPLHG